MSDRLPALTAGEAFLVEHLADPRNARAPRLDLECVHGSGPADRPHLVQRDAPSRMLLGGGDGAPDLPHNAEGVALVGDPRTDVHALVPQLHVWVLQAHKALESRAEADGVPAGRRSAVAQQQLRRHHRWVVLHEFLAHGRPGARRHRARRR